MQKKFLLFTFLVLALLFVHTFVFADNTNLGNELKDSMNKAGDAVENVKNAVTETTDNLMSKNNSDTMERDTTNNRNNGYTTVRTANNTAFGMSQTTWVWLVLGVVALIIILLSWYYMSESNKTARKRDHE